jgi:hypothetical protein
LFGLKVAPCRSPIVSGVVFERTLARSSGLLPIRGLPGGNSTRAFAWEGMR